MSEINSSNCNHNCEGCSANCGDRTAPQDMKIALHPRSSVKHVIGVVSGKGGVGKSFVSSLLASELQRRGKRTAVLDGDITGPSMAKVFGIKEKMYGDGELAYPAKTSTGIQVVSSNMMLDTDDQPVIWRGPILANMVKQFWTDVCWGELDYLFVDMPPGTGDVPLTVFQSLPLDGVVIVSSPQDLVQMIVKKAANMAAMMNVPVIGLVENYSFVRCPDCGKPIMVFGESHIDDVAAEMGVPVIGRIPIEPAMAAKVDAGCFDEVSNVYLESALAVLPD